MSKWNSIVLYDNTKIIQCASPCIDSLNIKIPSVYSQTYGAIYFMEDFKWASSHLLPTHPKLFITA